MKNTIEITMEVELPEGINIDDNLDEEFIDLFLLDSSTLSLVQKALQSVEVGIIKNLKWKEIEKV